MNTGAIVLCLYFSVLPTGGCTPTSPYAPEPTLSPPVGRTNISPPQPTSNATVPLGAHAHRHGHGGRQKCLKTINVSNSNHIRPTHRTKYGVRRNTGPDRCPPPLPRAPARAPRPATPPPSKQVGVAPLSHHTKLAGKSGKPCFPSFFLCCPLCVPIGAYSCTPLYSILAMQCGG